MPAFSRNETKGGVPVATRTEGAALRWLRCLQDLPRRSLHKEFRDYAALQDDAEGWARLRVVSRTGGGACGRRRGRHQNHTLQGAIAAASERTLPELSRRQPRTIAIQPLRAWE